MLHPSEEAPARPRLSEDLRSRLRIAFVVLTVTLLSTVAPVGFTAAPAVAAPGAAAPGAEAVAAGKVVFHEDFQSARPPTATNVQKISEYKGKGGQTYRATPAWDGQYCNGLLVKYEATQAVPRSRSAGACDAYAWSSLRALSKALGQWGIDTKTSTVRPEQNVAVAAFTHGGNPGPGTQAETVRPIPVVPGHSYVASSDLAQVNCRAGNPALMRFYFFQEDNKPIDAMGRAINTCSEAQKTYNIDAADGIKVGTYISAPFKATGKSLRFSMKNEQGNGTGNDAAFGNIRLVDVTSSLALEKSAAPSTIGKAGEEITYSFKVTNTGAATIKDVAVKEGEFSGSGKLSKVICPVEAKSLPAGKSVTCTATYTVTKADADAGRITNSATATGTPPVGDAVKSPPSRSQVMIKHSYPALSLEKKADTQKVERAGQKVAYTFTLTNTGDVPLTDPDIKEGEFTGSGTLSPVTCPKGASLLPGKSITCNATYTVTTADLAAGKVRNTATATSVPSGGGDPVTSTPSTSTVVAQQQAPAPSKSPDPGNLAHTGAGATMPIAGTAVVLLAAGGTVYFLRRRPQR